MTQELTQEILLNRMDKLYTKIGKIRPRSIRGLLLYLLEQNKRDTAPYVKSRRAKYDYNLALQVIMEFMSLVDDSTKYILDKPAYDELERLEKEKAKQQL